jgi:GDP-L-fucose synthase
LKVLITGGLGFLGAHVVSLLEREGHEAVPCSRRTGVDLQDRDGTARFFSAEKPDVVIHCAAHVGGIAYNELQPVGVFEDNVRIGLGLVDAMEKANIPRLINIMPNCTYPGGKQIYREEEWWDGEIHPSVLAYGLPRKMLWGLTRVHKKKWGLQYAHLILPNMYGPGDHFDPVRSHALGALIAKIVDAKRKNLKKITIWGTGKPIREWLYVEDGALAIGRVLDSFETVQQVEDGILNVGIGKGISVTEMAEIIRRHAEWDGEFIYDTARPDGDMIKLMASDRMRAVLDWSPPTDFEEGVKNTVQWHMALR